MKSTFIIILFWSLSFQLQAQTTRVLFIGNSYTGVNNLPGLVHDLALANGDTLIVDSYTPGGYTFELHSTDPNTIAKIYSQQWDYVILQEQSQLPSLSTASVWVYPFAEILDSLIHENNPCTETVFYMTWGRQNGDATYCPLYPPVCTYEGMQARLRESYMELALLNQATVGPVGAAWRYMRSLNPAFNLYQPDESHPSIHGSYLAACTFYATLFNKNTVGNTFLAGIPQTEATEIQNAVDAVAMDSIYQWYEHGNIPMAAFSFSSIGNNVQFQNHSLNGTIYSWDFGDGNNSAAMHPVHTYAAAGTYQVTLTVSDSCKSDIIIHQVTTGTTSISEANTCTFYETVNGNEWHFNCNLPIKEIQLYDIRGRKITGEIINAANGKIIFNSPDLPGGLYLIRVTGNNFSWSGKIFNN